MWWQATANLQLDVVSPRSYGHHPILVSPLFWLFRTKNFDWPASTVALLYKSRWQIELFFKWIKQHLRIKVFYGTSENAVMTPLWIAVSTYVLEAIVKQRLKLCLGL